MAELGRRAFDDTVQLFQLIFGGSAAQFNVDVEVLVRDGHFQPRQEILRQPAEDELAERLGDRALEVAASACAARDDRAEVAAPGLRLSSLHRAGSRLSKQISSGTAWSAHTEQPRETQIGGS